MANQRISTEGVEALRQVTNLHRITTLGTEALRQEVNLHRITAIGIEVLHRAPPVSGVTHGHRTTGTFGRR